MRYAGVTWLALLLLGCAVRGALTHSAKPQGSTMPQLPGISIPLDLRTFEVASADGRKGAFLKLSRLPDSVAYHSESKPARIVLEIKGPTGEETAEETFPGGDTLVSRFRVSRRFGVLRVVLDLQGDDPPEYSVHTMADWIMVRLDASDAG